MRAVEVSLRVLDLRAGVERRHPNLELLVCRLRLGGLLRSLLLTGIEDAGLLWWSRHFEGHLFGTIDAAGTLLVELGELLAVLLLRVGNLLTLRLLGLGLIQGL